MFVDRWLHIFRARVRTLLLRQRVECELERELRFHVARETLENVRSGMSQEQAHTAALRRLGGVTQIQEECRDMRRTAQIDATGNDLRFALRTLGRSRGFAAAIVLTMALAVGVNSAIFSVMDGVLLRPLPYRQPARLVRIFLHNVVFPKFPLNPYDFRDYRERSHSFESMAIYARDDLQLSGHGQPAHLASFAVTAGFFHVLGAVPAIGREFSRADEQQSSGHVAILSDHLWRSLFDPPRNPVGEKIRLNGTPYTIVGVMPQGLEHPGNDYHAVEYGGAVDVWTPFVFHDDPQNRGSHFTDAVGRLKPGVTVPAAAAELNAVMAAMAREHPGDRNWQVTVTPLAREVVGDSRQVLWILLAAVLVILTIACVNAANLLLARATIRRREMALRAALGAKRTRLIRQLLTESIVISLAGAALGAVLAVGGVRALVAVLPPGFPRAGDIHVNFLMFGFTLLLALATGILFGLAPAWQSSGVDLKQPLHDGSRGVTTGSRALGLRNALVVGEVALACLLLIGAGLVLRSFVNLLHTDPGFRAGHIVTASLSLRTPDYPKEKDISGFYERLIARLQATPGITSAAIGTDLPWTGYNENAGGFRLEGKAPPPPTAESHARYHAASPDYFRTLGIPLISGRFFDQRDRDPNVHHMIINRAMERRYWGGENAVGTRITFEDHPAEKDWLTVVGVVGDVKDAPAAAGAEPGLWWTLSNFAYPDVSLLVRGPVPENVLAADIRNALRELDPNLAVADLRSMQEIASGAFLGARFLLSMIALFATLALTLAAIGTYAVISYSMQQRRSEFGLRIALGAQPVTLWRFVFLGGMKLAAAGVIFGLGGGVLFGRLLSHLLYQVRPQDPVTLALAATTALLAAACACFVPAFRATRSDPMDSLRAE